MHRNDEKSKRARRGERASFLSTFFRKTIDTQQKKRYNTVTTL